MTKQLLYIIPLALLGVFTSSCSLTKKIKSDQSVYIGASIDVTDRKNAESVELFDITIEELAPAGTRTGPGNIYTGFYNIYDETNDNGFKKWIKNTLGDKPIIYDDQLRKQTTAKLEYYLNGKGFFGHSIKCDSIEEDQKTRIECEVDLGERYTIDSIVFPIDSTYAALKLDDRLRRAIIKEGKYYDRDRLDFERTRLATLAGNIGFADFGTENIYYFVDTTSQDNTVDVYVKVLTPTDSTFHTRYRLNEINLYPNYALNKDNETEEKVVPIKESNIIVHESHHYLSHDLLDRLITEKTGDWYSRTKEQNTINRLLDLGIFKFININNYPEIVDGKNVIRQDILITPERMQNVVGEVEINNRSGNYVGLGATARYVHKNIFRHAERLELSINTQLETQLESDLNFINSIDATAGARLMFPRLIVPFFNIRESYQYIPRTVANATYNYQKRFEFYDLQNVTLKFGYTWRQNRTVNHEFYPIVVNQLSISNKSENFEELLAVDPRLRVSFDDVFIGGLQYSFNYSDQINSEDRRYKFLRADIETSGNIISAFSGSTNVDDATIFGEKYAQYTMITLDARRYYPVKNGDFAFRIILGGGFAYGNSSQLPYVKQYVIGGSNSLRAFRLRGVGPGATVADKEDLNPFTAQFIDQTGDMKIEFNAEYRFPILGFFKGAVFADAGNVWLLGGEESQGKFKLQDFPTQLALGAGLGLRIDFNFFLIRMDIATPLRAPVINQGFEWIVKDFDILSSDWRKNNIRYNLGIGYPF